MITFIPDVHGRTFWKDAVQSAHLDDGTSSVIFLGDYHDPYPMEGITTEVSLQNFKQILQFKLEHPEQVTLLLGNHDLMKYVCSSMPACRTDFKHIVELQELFAQHRHLFQVAAIVEAEGQKVICSHAGILNRWASDRSVSEVLAVDPADIEGIVSRLNEMWRQNDSSLYSILDMASYYRGGYGEYGSPIWADLDEWYDDAPEYEGYLQVFGHSMLRERPYIRPTYAAIDCRQSITLSEVLKACQEAANREGV